jgi:hypothetical protein
MVSPRANVVTTGPYAPGDNQKRTLTFNAAGSVPAFLHPDSKQMKLNTTDIKRHIDHLQQLWFRCTDRFIEQRTSAASNLTSPSGAIVKDSARMLQRWNGSVVTEKEHRIAPPTLATTKEYAMTRQHSPLDSVKIASPCNASWEQMNGDDRARFCSHCKLNVYNLSGMSRPEAEALIRGAEGRLCVRYYQRADGTVITQDCPVGVQAVRQRLARRMRTVAAAILTFLSGTAGVYGSGVGQKQHEVKGRMAVRIEQLDDSTSTSIPDTLREQLPVLMGKMMFHEPATEPEAPAVPDTSESSSMVVMGELAIRDDLSSRSHGDTAVTANNHDDATTTRNDSTSSPGSDMHDLPDIR